MTAEAVFAPSQVRLEKVLCRFPRNDYEPNLVFFGLEESQRIAPSTLLHPVPDLVVEVLSPSTESLDRGTKFDDYSAHGVGEYWLIDPERETVEQWLQKDGVFQQALVKSREGTLASQIVPGFELPIRAIFDDQANLAFSRKILTPE